MSLPRYESYKDSGVKWLGEVPEHWEVKRVKNVANINMGQSPSSQDCNQDGNGTPFLQGNADFGETNPFPRHFCSVANKLSSTGDILFSVRAPVGAINISDQIYGIGRGLCAFTPNKFNFVKFFFFALEIVKSELFSVATGSTYEAVSVEQIANAIFIAPPIIEQNAIAQFLDQETAKIDNLIAEQQQLIKLLKEKRQAVISHAVTKGLNPDVPMKDSGVEWLGEVPEHWGIVRLRYLCKIETGDADTVDSNEDGSYPFFVRSPNIEKINRYTHDCEAILTAGDGVGVGKVFHYFDGKFCAHQRVYIFRQFEGVQGKFFFHYLKELFLRVVLEGTAKSTVDSLRRPMIADFLMTVPYIEEQSIIAEFLDKETAKIDNLIAESTNLISLSKERRSALISSAVTGKIDVRNYVSTQPQIEAMT